MARKFLVNIDLNKNELQNAIVHQLASAPGSPVQGQLYYNTTDDTVEFYDGAAFITLGKLNEIEAPDASVDLNSQKIINLATPTADADAATKAYVDASITGLDWKDSVRAATTANGALATAYENGDTVDGVVLATGDRILLKDQTTGSENGIYTVNASGAPTRATDADVSAEVTAGMAVFVEEGTTNADTAWLLTTNDPITLGTTALVFAQFSGGGSITAGAGLTKTGNTIDVISNHAFLVVNADNIDIGILPVADGGTGASDATTAKQNLSATSVFAASIGDGAALTYNVNHNMNTTDVVVQVFKISDGTEVTTDVTRSTVNQVIVGFASAPATNEYRVVVMGIDG